MLDLYIFTGRSGSGKSTALHNLEDSGYYCVDNIPLELLLSLLNTLEGRYQKIAVTLDVRNLTLPSADNVISYIDALKKQANIKIIYLDSHRETLLKRFSESRRLHPLSLREPELSLDEAINKEENLLCTLKQNADLIIDSSCMSIHQLNDMVSQTILGSDSKQLKVIFSSFGFKHGLPKDADFVFDVRFLPNPHWIPELKPLTGQDQPVQDYLSSCKEVNDFVWQLKIFLNNWLGALERNNRSYLTIAIGCTGGQHRSVYIVETLAKAFKEERDNIAILHRELD